MVMGGQRMEAKTLNISIGGMAIQSPLNLKSGTKLGIIFQVHIGSRFSTVQAECEAMHSIFGAGGDGFKTGLRFTQLSEAYRQTITNFMEA